MYKIYKQILKNLKKSNLCIVQVIGTPGSGKTILSNKIIRCFKGWEIIHQNNDYDGLKNNTLIFIDDKLGFDHTGKMMKALENIVENQDKLKVKLVIVVTNFRFKLVAPINDLLVFTFLSTEIMFDLTFTPIPKKAMKFIKNLSSYYLSKRKIKRKTRPYLLVPCTKNYPIFDDGILGRYGNRDL